jgi:hypothetical protein
LDSYLQPAIRDALTLVALALEKVINECLGDPLKKEVITKVLSNTKNKWPSTLKLSRALGSTPVSLEFDKIGHRKLPVALGNLVNGTWQVAGHYDPFMEKFIEKAQVRLTCPKPPPFPSLLANTTTPQPGRYVCGSLLGHRAHARSGHQVAENGQGSTTNVAHM